MRSHLIILFLLLATVNFINAQVGSVEDDFEGNGTITTWYGQDCSINTNRTNPFQADINTSNKVLEYHDTGGQYANIGFEVPNNYDLSTNYTFTLKIYVPTNGLTGNQTNQVSLKLQDGTLDEPWSTQTEIIKPISLDQWQSLTFDFRNDNYINLEPNSAPPIQRTDFNRIVIQVNGEDNNGEVLAYIDDFSYDGTIVVDPVYDNLIWADEFEEDGAINATNWFHQTQLPGGGSWFNNEIQHYTDRTTNAFVEDGLLKIVAKRETFTDQGETKAYTSARLNSKFAFQYGRVEVRAKLPTGVGTWPAIWMLGKNINEDGGYWDNQGFGTTPWPACGEIDIMEHWGDNQNYISSATHTPSSFGGTINVGGQTIATASTSFHVYALEWTPEKLVFSVDDVIHYTYNPTVKNTETWPFDAEQYFLLNVAILPNITPSFSSSAMEIDYIRVYQETPLSNTETSTVLNAEVYPTPFTNQLTIELENISNQNTSIELYTNDGKLINTYQVEINDNRIVLNNLDGIAKGLYIIKFKTRDRNYVSKVVKQ